MARRRGSAWAAAVRTPVGACSAVLLAVVVVLAVLGPAAVGRRRRGDRHRRDRAGAVRSAPGSAPTPSAATSCFRTLVATRLSIGLALLATAIGVGAGVVLGTLPSVLPRWAGRLLVAAVDIAVAFPGLLLALFFAVIFGVGTQGAVLAIAFAMAPAFARLVQTLSASVSGRDFIAAARIAGVGRIRLLARHVLPNIGEPLVVNATIGAGSSLLAFAGLSFLGIGVQAPDYDWGRLLREGLDGIYVSPVAALAPAAAVVLAGLAFNLVGETVAGGGRRPHARVAASAGSAAGRRPPAAVAEPDRRRGARRREPPGGVPRPGRVDRAGARGELQRPCR